jgi:hypothetical protein
MKLQWFARIEAADFLQKDYVEDLLRIAAFGSYDIIYF